MRALVLLTLLHAAHAIAATGTLSTHAERTHFRETGRYSEVIKLCAAFERAYPQQARCIEFGRTPQGRPMLAIAASTGGLLTAPGARRSGKPVVLVQGGIHAGEIDGKDAGFQVLRELLEEDGKRRTLEALTLLFVPVFNVDGHERFGAWNRPNQRGPQEMGWRTTAQNLNLNRDYAKAESPEMRAMLELIDAWDPLVVMDLHVTDGAQFEHDISIQVEPLNAGDDALRLIGRRLRDNTIARLEKRGSLPLPFYPSFAESDNPESGFVDAVSPPRFSTGYFWLRNRFCMLVETHSWKDYPTRVAATHDTVRAVLDHVALSGGKWLQSAHAADARAQQLGGTAMPVEFAAAAEPRTIEFRGFEYTRTLSPVSGALMTRYDEQSPSIWRIPLRDVVSPAHKVKAPQVAYLVPPEFAGVVEPVLVAHGLVFDRVAELHQSVDTEQWRAGTAVLDAGSVEGHQRVKLTGEWRAEAADVLPGTLRVPISQPLARLVHALLEPTAPDSLVAWGLFNNRFEQKEYMEDYVAEEVAQRMLATQPEVREAFERRLREDPAFAGDPRARLAFFARRHESWDRNFNLYPVMRIDKPLR